ncbi:MAG TPA: hypothetical protein VKD21_05165 [Acidimicrobiales bacterium]|nr:hypothetical protein [Acidimicrobiales bacterium]
MTQRLAERAARALSPRVGRRSFLTKSAIVGSALAAAPAKYILEPGTAYAAVCSCAGSRCDCGSACCDGYTEFCCAVTGINRCPPGTLTGGWWKVDGSSFCGGRARYYVDCNSTCGSCTCGGSGICSGSCSGRRCACAGGSCGNRRVGCNGFRYGQCHQNVRCLGPIVCRVVSCIPPWQTDSSCGSTVRVDNATRNHHRPCLTGNPYGRLDSVTAVEGGLRVRGWAVDPNTTGAIPVHIYIDDVGRAKLAANLSRSDVARAYPGAGANHGFDAVIRDVRPGYRNVCAYAINVGEGVSYTGIGCRRAFAEDDPFGRFEAAFMDFGKLHVRGWAIDPNTDGPISVHIYDNGRGRAKLAADVDRPEIDQQYARGRRHGFDAKLSLSPGRHEIQAWAINVGTGLNRLIGTRVVTWSGSPFGSIDTITALGGGRIRVTGWAIDADTTAPVRAHIRSDDTHIASFVAGLERSDLAPLGFGTAHGFDVTVTVGAGSHEICLWITNVGAGSHARAECNRVTVT